MIDFVAPEAPEAEEKLISIDASREAIHRAQRAANQPDVSEERKRIIAAAEAEERAQVARKPMAEEPVLVPTPHSAVGENRPKTIEELHAKIRAIRKEAAEKRVIPPPPAPPPRIAERTRLEMEAGARANDRAVQQREAELSAGRRTAEALPPAPAVVDPTVHTPVYRPNEPTPGLDQNKPFTMTRGG